MAPVVDKIKVYVIQTDTAGCYYQRLRMPLDALERAYPDEFEVCWSCEPKAGDGPAVVLGQRIMGAGDQPNPGWIDLCENPGILAVYEIDDDIIDLDPGNAVPYSIFTPNRAGTIANIAAADHIISATSNLAAKIGLLRRKSDTMTSYGITVAPNCILDGSIVERNDFGAPTIGWAGSMFHQQDFPPETVEQFARIRDAFPGARWVSIGHNYFGWGSTFGWGPISAYHERLRFVDIGLAPIQHTEFNKSKSWIKALDYMAHGVIPVVERWGQYPELVNDGMTGIVVDDEVENPWVEGLQYLLDLDRTEWASLRSHAYDTAREYQIGNQVHHWAEVFRLAREM